MIPELWVWVPNPGSPLRLFIEQGSGIVSRPLADTDDRVLISYEGNVYGMQNIVTYADRVYHAASRLLSHYPTIATAFPARTELVLVGTFDGTRVVLDGLDVVDVVDEWVGQKVTSEDMRVTHR